MAIICPSCSEIHFETIDSALTTCRACGDDLRGPAPVELVAEEAPLPLVATRPVMRTNWAAAVFGAAVLGGGIALAVLGQPDTHTTTARVGGRQPATATYTVDGRAYSLPAGDRPGGNEFTVHYDPRNPAAAGTARPMTWNSALLGGLVVGLAGLVLIALAVGVGGDFLLLRSAAGQPARGRANEPPAEPR